MNEGLKSLHLRAVALAIKFSHFHIEHVRRHRNKLADALCTRAINS
jgi:hypothetical protein